MGREHTVTELRRWLADPEVRAVVVTAPAGIGKTRLVTEATRDAAVPPLWWHASREAAAVPFGVLAGLVIGHEGEPSRIFHEVAGQVADAGGVLVVDDIPHLDARSADLLQRLLDGDKATVVATARAGEPIPGWLERLWIGERTCHLELGPLDGEATATLVDLVLPTAVARDRAALVPSLIERTAGNPLFLRELLADLRRRLHEGEPLGTDRAAPPHLLRVLDTRQRAAGPAVVDALRDVAVAGALPLAVFSDRYDAGAIAAAERAGLLAVDTDEGRAVVRPAHPLHAEAALATLTTSERRGRAIDVATAVLETPTVTVTDRLAATVTLLAHGAPVPSDVLVQAARTAFAVLDHDLAVTLATAAAAAGDPFEAKVVLGAAHSGANRPDDAEVALRDAVESATTDEQLARAAGRLSVHLVAHGSRVADASDVLDAAAERMHDPAALAYIEADRAKLASIRGDLTGVTTTLHDDADEVAVLNTSIVAAYAQAMAGDPQACRATIERALPLADAHRAILPWSSELVRFSGPFAALCEHGPVAARDEAMAGQQRAEASFESTIGTWQFLAGLTAALAGSLGEAATSLRAASHGLDGHDLIGARPVAIAAHAWVHAQTGAVDVARALIDASLDAAVVDGRVRAQVAVADAWCDLHDAGGAMSRTAATKVTDAAVAAADGGQLLIALIAINELIRLGDPGGATDALRRTARRAPSTWFTTFVHARAAAEVDRDTAALRRLANDAHGRWPLAEAELHAAIHRRASADGDATAAARAALTVHRCTDALGAVLPSTVSSIPHPLSAREQQVTDAIVEGASNRAIAEAAGVSVRTVDNQAQSIYRKLGLTGRADLRNLVDPGRRRPVRHRGLGRHQLEM